MNDRSRRCLPGLDTEITLSEELGPDHPLTRSVCCYRLLRRNCLTASSLLLPAVIATPLAGTMGIPVLIAASSAAIAFGVAAAILRPVCRERTIALLARGGCSSAPYVTLVAEELTTPLHRVAVAEALEQKLWQARHLEEIPLGTRPPPEVRPLRGASHELEAIIRSLRAHGSTSVHAVALCEQLITGGYGAPIYTRPLPERHQQLTRIRYLFDRHERQENRDERPERKRRDAPPPDRDIGRSTA